MTTIDPTTPLGKVRLRIGDWSDLQILPDAVIQSALDDCNNSLGRTAQLCAQYILATLTAKTHKKLATVEMWSGDQFNNYVEFLKLTVLNPNFMAIAPIPYIGSAANVHPLQEFMNEWKAGYYPGTVILPPGSYNVSPQVIIIDDNPS